MHVGIPVNTADVSYQSNVPVNRLSNNELKTSCGPPNQNGLRPCYNESNHESSSVHARNTSLRANQFNKSSSLGNLSFINIVGLPYHPRQSSVPTTTTLRNQVGSDSTIFPNHFRYASESNAVPPRPPRTSVPSNFNNATVEGSSQVKGAPPAPAKGHVPPEMRWNKSGGTAIDRVNSAVTLTYQFNNLGFPYTTISNQQSTGPLITPPRATTFSEPCRIQSNDIPINQIDNQENVSNVNVNFHRTLPTNARMNVISAVPTIKCLNTHSAKNVSNVQIMPLSGTNSDQNAGSSSSPCKTSITSSQVTVHNEQTPTQLISPSTTETVSSVYLSNRAVPQRTFTSTEAQTDDTDLAALELISIDRERRRRERRERRVHRRANPVCARPTGEISTQTNNADNSGTLPDILDSHLPPPYTSHPNTLQRNQSIPNIHAVPGRIMPPHLGMIPTTPPQILNGIVPPPGFAPGMVPHPRPRGAIQTIVPSNVPHVSFPPPSAIPGQVPLVQNVPDPNSGYRFALPVGQFRREHFSEEAPKGCCGVLTLKPESLKWFIASVVLVAVGCVLVGIALGTMRPAGRDHITTALLLIGIGIVIVTISGVAWCLASHNTTSCRTMLGIGSLESVDVCARRFVPRLPPSYGRPHHPYAAMMYPEFQYRPPPPTYQASMQEYRLRLLLIDRGNTPQIQAGTQNAVSPPPTYRSHTGSLIRDPLSARNEVAWSEYSCPPSYRSQTYSTRLDTIQDSVSVHTRDPSLSLSERTNDNAIDVVNILRNSDEDVALETITLDSKTDQDSSPYKLILEDCGGSLDNNKEENLVTIVQTDDRSPVIVTVSGSSSSENTGSNDKSSSEIQILAHL